MCAACAAPHAHWVESLGATLCMACEKIGPGLPIREPVRVGDLLAAAKEALAGTHRTVPAVVPAPGAAAPSVAHCRKCGGRGTWHRTVHNRWMIMQPGAYPVGPVPVGKRWRVAGDGSAVNLRDSHPSDTCRISHFDVCPAGPAPVGSAFLLSLWRRNAEPNA